MRNILTSIIIVLLLMGCASPRPWTKEEKTAAGFFLLAHTANAFTTSQLENNGNYEKFNFIIKEHPSDTIVGIYFSVTAGLALGISHYWPSLRQPLLYGYGSLNTSLAIHDYNLNSKKN